MLFLKKALNWLKRHWYVGAILILGVVLWFVYRPASTALFKMVEKTRARHKEEVTEIEKTYKDEAEEKKKAHKEYREAVEDAETEYDETQEELERKKKERVEELTELHKDDPDLLTEKLSELGGFKVIKADED